MVVYGDNLTDFDLSAMIEFHQEKNAIATLAVFKVPNPWEVGIVKMAKNARILILSVDNSYRRRGIGDRLLRALIYQCYQKNLNILQLEVRVNNNDAIRFYTHHKFIIDRVITGYYKNGDNGYLMYKILR